MEEWFSDGTRGVWPWFHVKKYNAVMSIKVTFLITISFSCGKYFLVLVLKKNFRRNLFVSSLRFIHLNPISSKRTKVANFYTNVIVLWCDFLVSKKCTRYLNACPAGTGPWALHCTDLASSLKENHHHY